MKPPRCRHTHDTRMPDDYLARSAWMAKTARTHDQTACPGCGLFRVWKRRASVTPSSAGVGGKA